MISVLGLKPKDAIKALEAEGFSVCLKEVRSKKGVDGDSERVIRQRLTADDTVELCFAQISECPKEKQTAGIDGE